MASGVGGGRRQPAERHWSRAPADTARGFAPGHFSGIGRGDAERPAARGAIPSCPELDCLRGRLPPGVLAAAAARAARIGVGADRVLIEAGILREEDYVRVLASWLRLPFESMWDIPRACCPLPDERLLHCARVPILPVQLGDGPARVVAPRGIAVRLLIKAARGHGALRHVRLAAPAAFDRFVARHGARALGEEAAFGLAARFPLLAARRLPSPRAIWGIPLAAALAIAVALAPSLALAGLTVGLTLLFMGWTLLRLICLFTPPAEVAPRAELSDAELPLYTVIVALYREAASVPGLVAALEALDYPAEKLDVKFAVEDDDAATCAALAALPLRPAFEVVVAPPVGPRTKPKALNAALAFARGDLTVVYDAEDRPEPDQLRKAAAMFAQAGGALACAQARLTIDNTRDGWLAALFTAEYAGHFDVLLPGLAARRLLMPLGGSSNHFRTDVLRDIGGWDAYNVTEDADLGTRLARFGYATAMLDSTTYEEAPARIGPWIRQRTRWLKGWMRTSVVHMRQPLRFAGDIGAAGFLTFHLTLAGTVVAALVQPYLAVLFCVLAFGGMPALPSSAGAQTLLLVHAASGLAGYGMAAVLAYAGLRRRGLRRIGWVVALMPVHWALLSVAAWRALFQLAFKPHFWEKTAHGLARTSRRGRPVGEAGDVRDSARGRRRPLRARA